MKPTLCLPRLRTNAAACGRKNRRVGQMSLLERLRDAVLRFIMLSAISKASSAQHSDKYNKNSCKNIAGERSKSNDNCYQPPEPHHSEAVADCIEFIKKSSTGESGRDSTASTSSSEMIFRVPVM